MLAPRVAPRQRRRRQPVAGHRHELVALEPEQARGVARDQPPHRREQPRVAVGRRQRRREIAGDVEEDFERLTQLLLIRQRVAIPSTPSR